jgi:Xaa-Pro aminopeptidase
MPTGTPIFYPGDELHRVKNEKIQDALGENGLDAFLFTKHDAVRYVTDFYVKGYRPYPELEYLTIVPKGRAPVLGYSLSGEEPRIRERSEVQDFRRLYGLANWPKVIEAILVDYGLTSSRIGVDLLPYEMYLSLVERLPDVEFVPASDLWSHLTAVKHPLEIGVIREALRLSQVGMQTALDVLSAGKTELEVSAAAEYVMRAGGSEMNPFIPVVASGRNAIIWERVATDKIIEDGDMVIIDVGCVYKGYTGDFARTTVVGNPNSKQREIYTVAHKALQASIEAVKPGVLCSEIDAASRAVIARYGYTKYENAWATGHQLGYGLHGAPHINRGVDLPLEPNMVVNIEPSIFTYDDPSGGGVELENTVLVTESGYELLTPFPFDDRLL